MPKTKAKERKTKRNLLIAIFLNCCRFFVGVLMKMMKVEELEGSLYRGKMKIGVRRVQVEIKRLLVGMNNHEESIMEVKSVRKMREKNVCDLKIT